MTQKAITRALVERAKKDRGDDFSAVEFALDYAEGLIKVMELEGYKVFLQFGYLTITKNDKIRLQLNTDLIYRMTADSIEIIEHALGLADD